MRSITILLGIVVVLLLANSNASACSCGIPRSPCQSYGWSAAVFVGTVVGPSEKEGSNPKNPNAIDWAAPVTYKFSVEQAYLGVPGTQIEVSTGNGFGDCGYGFQTGRRYLVYAHLHKGRLVTSICSRTKPFEAATEDLAFLDTLSSRAPGVTISGEILSNQDGQTKFSSPDMLITIESEGQRIEVRPDAAGEFTVSGIKPGKLKVILKLPETLTATEPDRELTVANRGCARVVWYIKHKTR